MDKTRKKKVMLISNKVYHYRVSIYNFLNSRLNDIGYELVVLTNEVQKDNPHKPNFRLIEKPFGFAGYTAEIASVQPQQVMLFLHIKDFIVWPLILWLKAKSIDIIYWNHGVNLQTPNDAVKKVIFNLFHRSADAIVLYSKNEKKYVARKYWHKLFIANNTINFESIPDIADAKENIRTELCIPFEKVVLFVGRIVENKRIDDLIACAPHLADGTGVVIVGGGMSAQQIEDIEKSDNIRYLGEVYDSLLVNRIFKMSDIFCIPGSMGLGINQAFFWGLPVVTEDVRHSPEIVYLKDGSNGFVVNKGDIKMLADRINSLTASPAKYAEFSAAAKSVIMTEAGIDIMCDGFIEAINYLNAGEKQPRPGEEGASSQ